MARACCNAAKQSSVQSFRKPCYNIDTQKAGPLKRRWPGYLELIKDRPQPAKVTGTVFYFQ